MRKTTQQAVKAFINGENFKQGATIVENTENGITMRLHGHLIATNTKDGYLHISNCGYYTRVTKERLNGILYAFNLETIYQNGGEWYRNKEHFKGGEIIEL